VSRLLPRERRVSWRRVIAAGATAAAIVLAVGLVSELQRFGASDQAAAARMAARVQGDFSDTTRVLSDVAAGVAATDAAARGLALGDDGQRGIPDFGKQWDRSCTTRTVSGGLISSTGSTSDLFVAGRLHPADHNIAECWAVIRRRFYLYRYL